LEKHQSIISYLLILLIFLILLKITGFFNIHNVELLGYVFITFGLSYVFNSFGNKRKGVLFSSTVIFLIGLVLFIISNFEIQHLSKLIIPSILMIIGIGLLMTYIDGDQITNILLISLLFIASGIIITITHGEMTFHSFFSSFIGVTEKYWSIILIFAGVFLLFRKGKT
jgi:hypothetical protein